MRTRAWQTAAALLVVAGAGLVSACSGGSAQPSSLAISPANPGTVYGTQLFSTTRVNDDAAITWALSGPGSISSTSGSATTYSAPPLGASGSATLTATTADGLTASVTFTAASPQLSPGTVPGLSAAVQIDYDAQDIPHLTCAAITDCLEAQGYLQARDRLFQMDLFRRTARGQLASLIGPLELSSDEEFLTFFTTRDGKRIEDELVDALDPNTATLLGAFVSGVNAYITELQTNPSEPLPGEYAQLPDPLTAQDIPAWTAQDTLAIGRLEEFQLSETIDEEINYGMFAAAYGPGAPLADPSKFAAWLRAQETQQSYTLPIGSQAGTTSAARPARAAAHLPNPLAHALTLLSQYGSVLQGAHGKISEAKALLGNLGVAVGSNNWAVDAAHSATGQAMVANDPHLALTYPPLFHLIAMTATDTSGLDVQGGSFPGTPGVLIGRGKHVGWGLTVTGYDVTDLYLEQVVPCTAPTTGDCVSFTAPGSNTASQLQLQPVTVTIDVRGQSEPVAYTILVNPMHGPFINLDQSTGLGLSMRWTGHEISGEQGALLGLNVASGIGGVADVGGSSGSAFASLHGWGTGAQNFVMADDQGNIGYDPHALVPRRPWIGTSGYPWFPLPGDGSAEWGSQDPDDNCAGTPSLGASMLPSANCWYPDADLPHADASNNSNTGFLVTANSDPAGYGDSNNPVHVITIGASPEPFYLSFDWDDPTGFRMARVTALLAAKTASGPVAFSDMEAIQTDHVSSVAGAFIADIDFIKANAGAAIPAADAAAFDAAVALLDAWAAVGTNTTPLDCPTGLSTSSPSSAPTTDATQASNSAACFLFHVFVRTLLNNVFADDMLAATNYTQPDPPAAPIPLDAAEAIRGMLYMLEPANLGTNTDQTFCNNVSSAGQIIGGPTSCATQVVTALLTAYGTLAALKGAPANWIWGEAHTLTTASAAAPIVDATYGAGPYARPGGLLTVDVGNPDLTSANPLAFPYTAGANLRMVAAINTSTAPSTTAMQLPGPERDAPYGVFASTPDLIGQYAQNLYFDFAYSAASAQSTVSTQTLNPGTAQ